MKLKHFLLILSSVLIVSQCDAQQRNKKKQTKTTQQMENKDTRIVIKTSMGDMVAVLYANTPYHTKNFLKLIDEHFYDGLLFHRVIKDFMIQGGDPDSKDAPAGKALGSGGPGYTIPAEITPTYFHKRGALSAARLGDQMNPTRRSSGSQFYVVTGKVYTENELNQMEKQLRSEFTPEQRKAYTTVGGTPFLDAQYTVFGQVVEGIDVALKISKVAKNGSDRPNEDVKIISITVEK